MNLIVISNPNNTEQEVDIVNQLFDEGLQLFHLRKPNANATELRKFLTQINVSNRTNIVLHQHHYIAEEFGIKRLHYKEEERSKNKSLKVNSSKIVSTSVHSIEAYNSLDSIFEYAFIGPVFDSISKVNYKAIELNHNLLKNSIAKIKKIAIGGIEKKNIPLAFEMGFDGVAVLGSIWGNKFPINQFKQLKAECNNYANTF